MGLPQMLAQWLVTDRVAQLAEKIAVRCRMQVWQRVAHRLPAMQGAEAKGYVRSRAVMPITAETEKLLAEENMSSPKLRDALIPAAVEAMVRMLCDSRSRVIKTQPGKRRVA